MKLRKPHHLKKGDRIGIVSPSSTIHQFPRRFSRSIEYVNKELGLEVVIGENALSHDSFSGGTPKKRVLDIHTFFQDPSIKAIICSTGGYSSNSILDYLDYDLIEKNPKIFCGFSDITVLNNAIAKMSNIVTFHGPMLLTSFGSLGGADSFTKEYFIKSLFSTLPLGVLNAAEKYSDESLFWDKEDNRDLLYKVAVKYSVLHQAGVVSGELWGGNLDTLCILIGTKYCPDFDQKVLLIEDGSSNIARIERNLNFLDQAGIFKKIGAMIVGRFVESNDQDYILKILKKIGEKYNIPIVINVDIGHTKPLVTIPIGVEVIIDSVNSTISFLESGVI